MRSFVTCFAAAILIVAAANPAAAQRDGRDAADRGQRLDLDALRNDMLQRQLKAPENPLWLAPPNLSQPPATPAPAKKRKSTSKKS